MIPISSNTAKFKAVYDSLQMKYKRCDTIVFADVLGYRKAFLLQNMCPATDSYVSDEYSNAAVPVRIQGDEEKLLVSKAKYVLHLLRQGKSLIFPDVLVIERALTAPAR